MRKALLFSLILLTSVLALADGIKFTAKSSPKAGVGQQFQVQFTLNKKPTELNLGDYSGLTLVGGPSFSSSSNVVISNGNYTQEHNYIYTYAFKASKTGTYTIGGATAKVDGKTVTSNSTSVVIQEEQVQSNNSRRRNSYDPFEELYNMMSYGSNNAQPRELTDDDVFVKVFVDKTNLYKGEHLTVTIKFYTKVSVVGGEDKLPGFDDFIVEDFDIDGKWVRENYNNQVYNTQIIKKAILYPRTSGELKIAPCVFDLKIQQPMQGGRMGYYGSQNILNKTISSPEIKINVKPLPSNAPESFTGAVGSFDLEMIQSEDTVLVNDAISLKLKISGNGNFDMVEAPVISWPKEFEIYEPVAERNINTYSSGVQGNKTWEYTIIPRYPGIFNLGAISFTYFDSSTKQYKTLKSDEINIAVKKDKNDTDFGQNSYNYSQKNIDYISEDDIRFVNYKNLNLVQSYTPIVSRGFYSWLFIIPFVLFVALVIVMRKRIKENANLAMVKQRKAGRTSQKRLKQAKKFMLKDLKTEFYKEIISALWGYCGDKLEIQVADLTKDRINDILIDKGIDPVLVRKLIEVIDKCEFAHFAPSSAETELSYIYKEASAIIDNLEQTIK